MGMASSPGNNGGVKTNSAGKKEESQTGGGKNMQVKRVSV